MPRQNYLPRVWVDEGEEEVKEDEGAGNLMKYFRGLFTFAWALQTDRQQAPHRKQGL